MSKKFRISQMEITSSANNRSGIRTTNMTSVTPDQVVGTTFKNVQVNENGEFVVGPLGTGGTTVQYTTGTTAPASPNVGDYWEDTTIPTSPVINLWSGTVWKKIYPTEEFIATHWLRDV